MTAQPSQKQRDFLDWEMGAFFHFGIRTFYEGHRDWDLQEMPLAGFNPTALDCGQWVRTAKEAGCRYAILVCKHHDGFANWPSAYTDYSVANTPWKGGKGDIVREFTDACREYGLKVGLYYSPAQFGSKDMDGKAYDDYFINQISELLTGYGKIDYLWFDGCGSEGHEYDTARIVAAIRRMQPEILIFNMWDPDTRWIGNEAGIAPLYNPNVVKELEFSIQTEEKDKLDETRYLPGECDFRMRRENWFYSDQDEDTVKSVEELMAIYDYSVGRGANFLINIGPDRRGLLPDADAKRLLAFGEALRRRFANPIPCAVEPDGDGYRCTLEAPALVDTAVLAEELGGEFIEEFSVWASPFPYGVPICVYQGRTVGHKAICTFPPIWTKEIAVRTDGKAPLTAVKLYHGRG